MSNNIILEVSGISKLYLTYSKPQHRFMQFIKSALKAGLIREEKIHNKINAYLGETEPTHYLALNNVSFEVKRGEILGIVGLNGAGKSTLLKLLCGTLHPSQGRIKVYGKIAALLELGSGFNKDFTGKENIYLYASVLGLSQQQIVDRYSKIVEFADIGNFLNQPLKTYSSGMMMRLAFAVVAHVDADILIIDEALAVGDAYFVQKCMRFLRNFAEHNTLLFVSHDLSAVANLCSRVLLLEAGSVLAIGNPKEVVNIYMEKVYEKEHGLSNPIAKKFINKNQSADSNRVVYADQRLKFLNHSNLRNDIQIFNFNHQSDCFGRGDILVRSTRLMDENKSILNWCVGGELVILEVECEVISEVSSPIVGFFVRDRLGQNLFGDNTYLIEDISAMILVPGNKLVASFSFYMPIMPKGDYSICVAVATGTEESHIQQQWIHEALIFKSISTSISAGLVGVPMHNILVQKI